MTYQFDQSFVLDTTKYEATFKETGTPLDQAIATTVAWYRNRRFPAHDDRTTIASHVLAGSPETERKEHKP